MDSVSRLPPRPCAAVGHTQDPVHRRGYDGCRQPAAPSPNRPPQGWDSVSTPRLSCLMAEEVEFLLKGLSQSSTTSTLCGCGLLPKIRSTVESMTVVDDNPQLLLTGIHKDGTQSVINHIDLAQLWATPKKWSIAKFIRIIEPTYYQTQNHFPHQYFEGPDDGMVGEPLGDERTRQSVSIYGAVPDELIRIMDSDRRFLIEQVFRLECRQSSASRENDRLVF